MAIDDAQRAMLSRLAIEALDDVAEEYGDREDVQVRAAIIVYEVGWVEDDDLVSVVHVGATTPRTIEQVGLLELGRATVAERRED